MKKFLVCVFTLLSMTSCAVMSTQSLPTGKTKYTKQTSATRLFMFGNPSVVDMANQAKMTEIVSVEKDDYILFNVTTVKGN